MTAKETEMSAKPEAQGERAELVRYLMKIPDAVVRRAATLLAADGAGNGEVALGILRRGEGGEFRVGPNMDALMAIYAKPPGEHLLYPRPKPAAQVGGEVASGSVMTREAAIEFWQRRHAGETPTEQIISATIDAYSALFGDLAPVHPQPAAQVAQPLTSPGLMNRYEKLRCECLRYGNLHPDSKEVCHQALKRSDIPSLMWRLASLLDDMALALGDGKDQE